MKYTDRIIKAQSILNLGPGVSHVHVKHDAFCPVINEGTICVCNPDIEIGDYTIDNDGNPIKKEQS
jgi:hypothetical protein